MTDLTTWRANLGSLIGASVDATTWTASVLDEALRHGLRVYTDRGPISEESYIVAEAGAQHDLDTLPDFYSLVGLAWPWSVGAEWGRGAIRWRLMGAASGILLG